MSQSALNLLISWFPFILLIAFWVYFMRKSGVMGRQQEYIKRNIALLERQQVLLERIAVALENRAKER